MEPINAPPKILIDQARVIILDSVFSPFVKSSRTSQPTMIALIDFTIEKDKMGRATPGKHQTLIKLTFCSVSPELEVVDDSYLSGAYKFY